VIYRNPKWLILSPVLLSLTFPFALALDNHRRPLEESSWWALGVLQLFAIGLAFYLYWQRVTVVGDQVQIRGFQLQSFRATDIRAIARIRLWHSMSVVLRLESGEQITVPGYMEEFEALVEALKNLGGSGVKLEELRQQY
jgi:hypothetical protein